MESESSSTVELQVTPRTCNIDEKVHIQVTGLRPEQDVTLAARVDTSDGGVFVAHAFFTADIQGIMDLTRMPSLGGTWTG